MSSSDPPKKKTRRRLRVSCVECTRRRQKCDREQPCGLCKSRGVENMCRWELEPFARPPPARPPPLRSKNGRNASDDRRSESAGESSDGLTTGALTSHMGVSLPLHTSTQQDSALVEEEVKEAAIALAQLSLARRGEYLGLGSLVCSLYRVGDPDDTQIALEKSIDLQAPWNDPYHHNSTNSFGSAFRALVIGLPVKQTSDFLFADFFETCNWRYSFPKHILTYMYDRMWETLQSTSLGADRINVHWLTCLYSIFAVTETKIPTPHQDSSHESPHSNDEDRRSWFLHALSGRRLAEGMHCVSSSYSPAPPWLQEGTIYGCLAVVLLADYLCDRGNCSEAWKMIGSSVRTAQTLGLHRNPYLYKWKDMAKDDALLRERTWRLLCNIDSVLSFLLGRPPIVRASDNDVPLPKEWPEPLALDGSSDVTLFYHTGKSSLMALIGEACEKCFKIERALYDTVFSVDAKLKAWETGLPAILSTQAPDTSVDHIYPLLSLQRCSLHIYYYQSRMILFRPFMSLRSMRADELGIDTRRCRYECVTSALAAIRTQEYLRRSVPSQYHYRPVFATTFFLFDAATTLCIAVLEDPQLAVARESLDYLERAVGMLQADREADTGGMVQRALRVLSDLCVACQKRRLIGKSGATSSESSSVAHSNGPDNMRGASSTMQFCAPSHGVVPPIPLSTNDQTLPYDTSLDTVASNLGSVFTSFDLLQGIDEASMHGADGIDWQALFDDVPRSPKHQDLYTNHYGFS